MTSIATLSRCYCKNSKQCDVNFFPMSCRPTSWKNSTKNTYKWISQLAIILHKYENIPCVRSSPRMGGKEESRFIYFVRLCSWPRRPHKNISSLRRKSAVWTSTSALAPFHFFFFFECSVVLWSTGCPGEGSRWKSAPHQRLSQSTSECFLSPPQAENALSLALRQY